ncbi:MAG: hypothetical protein M1820_003489 [Bogoriella megaspora]|nr:MAG: hypothetical protein M1820_003489 [Bogoriella megaspora]
MKFLGLLYALASIPESFAAPRRLLTRSDETDIAPGLTSVPANSSIGTTSPTTETYRLSSDDTFQFQLLLMNGLATFHGSDTNEVLKTAMYIEPGNFEGFSEAFKALADKTKADADATSEASDAINARNRYFAAASYYRAADFYLHGNWSDPRINAYWNLQTQCYNKALYALPVPGQRVTLPADGFEVEAIFYAPEYPSPYVKRPTIIMGNGYDAAQEELMHFFVFPALARGYNVITYEGPGQPTVRRNQDIGFIYDWERAVKPVVDYLYQRQDIDFTRLALLGNSFGGYLAARAAALEPRIKALLLDGGIYDTHTSFTDQLPDVLKNLYQSGQKEELDESIAQALRDPQQPSGLRWGVEQGLWSFKIESAYDFLESVRAYSVANLTDKIQMPTWIASAANDQFYAGQPEQLKKALGDRATLHKFDGAAGYHTQVGATEEANRVIFTWLNQVFNISSQNSHSYGVY